MSKTTIVSVSLPDRLAKELDKTARAQAMTRSEFVRDMLRRRLAVEQLREARKDARASATSYRSAKHLLDDVLS
jgi:metal-responsive CopG/Arc/MetJ family transcriptional regulator